MTTNNANVKEAGGLPLFTELPGETEQELRRHLEGVDFAANTEDLIAMAMYNGAPEDFIGELEELPRKEFEDLKEVAEAIKDIRKTDK